MSKDESFFKSPSHRVSEFVYFFLTWRLGDSGTQRLIKRTNKD